MTNDRYDTSGLDEARYQPGSNDTVLLNLRGITSVAEMDQMETLALLQVTAAMIDCFDEEHKFTAEDIRSIHREWLCGIYPWAGNYRQVMMSKDGFPFAAPAFIPNLMAEFEQKILARHTPCRGDDENVVNH